MSNEKQSSLGKRTARPVDEASEFGQYHHKTMLKTEEIKRQIEGTTDKKEIKRLRNKISAYHSRLHKRMDVEQLKEQVDIRNKQIEVMLKVLQQDLPGDQLKNIMRRIKDEAPTINRQDSRQQQ